MQDEAVATLGLIGFAPFGDKRLLRAFARIAVMLGIVVAAAAFAGARRSQNRPKRGRAERLVFRIGLEDGQIRVGVPNGAQRGVVGIVRDLRQQGADRALEFILLLGQAGRAARRENRLTKLRPQRAEARHAPQQLGLCVRGGPQHGDVALQRVGERREWRFDQRRECAEPEIETATEPRLETAHGGAAAPASARRNWPASRDRRHGRASRFSERRFFDTLAAEGHDLRARRRPRRGTARRRKS
jgi:hypothetical protein